MKKLKQMAPAVGAPTAVTAKNPLWYWVKCAALIIFLMIWCWFIGNQAKWWLAGSEPVKPTTSSTLPALRQVDDATSGAGTATIKDTASSTNDRTTGTGGGGTTNITYNNGGGGGGGNGGGGGGGDEDQSCSTTLASLFDSIRNGQTEAEVVKAACQLTPKCTALNTGVLGGQKICTFTEGKNQVIVVLVNDQVVAKSNVPL